MDQETIDFLLLIGIYAGPAVILLGKLFIGRRDRRTKTGWRNNRKPKWLPGIICYLIGGIWTVFAFIPVIQS